MDSDFRAPVSAQLSTKSSVAPHDALLAASLVTTALHQRLPRELTTHIVSFLAGSAGWTIDDTSAFGLPQLIEWIHAAGPFTTAAVCSSLAMDRVAGTGNLALVRWLHENRNEGCSQMAFCSAAKHNHLRLLQWLFDHKNATNSQFCGLESEVLYRAVQSGHKRVVEWLCTKRPTITPLYNVFDQACLCGYLSIVRLLHRLGRTAPSLAKSSTNALDSAADQGHLEVVQWLHAYRTEGCTTSAMDHAAARGHLRVAQWLHANRYKGCTRKALLNAAASSHVEVVT